MTRDKHLNMQQFTDALINLFSNTDKKHDLLFNIFIASSVPDNPLRRLQIIDFERLSAELEQLDQERLKGAKK